MSELTLNNQDGSTTTFNFKFDNGLPVKPIINPAYKEMFSEKNSYYVLSMYLTDDDLEKLGTLNIESIAYSLEQREIWLLMNQHYVVFGDVSDKIIEEAQKDKLVFYFFKENGEFIDGTKI